MFRAPEPDDSVLVRIAMLMMALLSLGAGLIAAIQFHYAALILIPFAVVVLWGWWLTAMRRFKRSQRMELPPPQMTETAVEELTELIESDPYAGAIYVRLARIQGPGNEHQTTLTLTGQPDEASERTIEQHGLLFVIGMDDLEYFSNCVVDFGEADGRSGFIFRRQPWMD